MLIFCLKTCNTSWSCEVIQGRGFCSTLVKVNSLNQYCATIKKALLNSFWGNVYLKKSRYQPKSFSFFWINTFEITDTSPRGDNLISSMQSTLVWINREFQGVFPWMTMQPAPFSSSIQSQATKTDIDRSIKKIPRLRLPDHLQSSYD